MTQQELTQWEAPEPVKQGRDIVDGWAGQIADVARLADYISRAPMVPGEYQGNPAALAACILAGREIGIGPMTALQHLHVIDGRPAMSAQLMRALVLAAGHRLIVREATATRVVIQGQRRDQHGPESIVTVTWTTEDARRANLLTRTNWARYPRQMLLARATAELCRGLFPDVIWGMSYAVEEADDIPAEEAPEQAPPARTVRRNHHAAGPKTPPPPPPSVTAPETPRPQRTSSPPGGEPPPLPPRPPATAIGSAGQADGEPPPLPPDAPVTPPSAPQEPPADEEGTGRMSGPQRAKLHALLRGLGVQEPREERLRILGGLIGRRIESSDQIARVEATPLIDTLTRAVETPEILEPLVLAGWERISQSPDTPTLWEPPNDADTDD